MYLLTTLAYPAVLALLCAGAGLLVDRAAGGWLPGSLLLPVGAAALIALSQLSTYLSALAPATPYLMLALAAAGFALGAGRLRVARAEARRLRWPVAVPVLTYAIALAPVLLSGRATFSSYMALADSAVHMLGADFLMRHGQDYSGLDLHNSYGQFIHNYYGTSYPSGADTLFGGSAFLLGLPLIWAFQPFNAFMLACGSGSAWVLARQIGLRGGWAAVAAITATVPALVYAYELLGSVKEITALAMILALGALAVLHGRWLSGPARRALPFALAAAAGVSALGAGFGVWVAASCGGLVVALAGQARRRAVRVRPLLAIAGAGVLVGLVCAWPTWADLSGSLRVASNIASTSNPGNLHAPLKATQLFGVWLRGSYKLSPTGLAGGFTDAFVALAIAACLLGAVELVRRRALALAAWVALMLIAWAAVSASATTWVKAKAMMLTSPAIVLLAFAGVAALQGYTRARGRAWAAGALALALAGGVIASDAAQYHSSNLAPTARYEELASLNGRFAGRGPTVVTDFDEYALYELRDLDIGGPDFAYPPPALAGLARGYGYPVALDRAAPVVLDAYPLIVTRRDPAASPPPGAFRLIWQGTYYRVWARAPGAAPALAHVRPSGPPASRCRQLAALARLAARSGARLSAAAAPALIAIPLARSAHPARWGHQRGGLVLSSAGRLTANFAIPRAGLWDVWLEGQLMPAVSVYVDGHRLGAIGGQLAGNSLVPDTMTPLAVRLSLGAHRLSVRRGGLTLAPGDGGAAVLDAIFLAPAGAPARRQVELDPAAGTGALCRAPYLWVEAVNG